MKSHDPLKDFSFYDFFSIFSKYKWSILFITLLITVLSYVYLYFKPSIYNSYAIIKVKSHSSTSKDLIKNTAFTAPIKDVVEEISLLKTYKINEKVLDKLNFKVQYYKDDNYKKVEIFNNIPITIKNIKIYNKKILNKKISLLPHKDGFRIFYMLSYKEKLKKFIFDKVEISFDKDKVYNYNTLIKTKYFEIYVQNNKKAINTPLHFVLNGDSRRIYETKIKKNLHISQLEKDTALIKISYDDNIPQRAQLYVESLTKNFIKNSITSKRNQNLKTRNVITEELNKIKKDLKSSESELERYQKTKRILNPSTQGSLFLKNLSDIEIELSENDLKQKLITNLLNFVSENYNLNAVAPSLSRLNEKHTLKLLTDLQEKQLLIEKLSNEYTSEYPELKILQKQTSNIRRRIIDNLKSLKVNIEYKNQSLLKRKSTYEHDLESLPAQERQLVNIKRNYEVKSTMYAYLLKKESENKIIQHATSSDYKIIDHAYTAERPIKPLRTIILLLSVFLGFIIGFIIAFLRQLKNNHILSKQDLEMLTSLPIYGSIPFYKQRSNNIEVIKEIKSPFTESFRTLRTNLQFLTKEKDSLSILVTSAIAGEGKSTTVSNLATILNKARYKTIVINLDLRKPTLHKFFSVDNSIGMSTYLNGQHNDISEIISQTEFGELDIIPSGPIPKDPSELILSPLLPKLIKELKNRYEYVIIDTAPIGLVTDTKTIMQYCDLNLILIRANYSKSNFIPILEEMIVKYNFQNIGLILNGAKDTGGGEYGYGYSYEYK